MKEISIAIWELTKEEAQKLTKKQQVLIYNPIMNTFKVQYGGRNCIANSKRAIKELKYFSFVDLSKTQK